jgi:hypothetical protein
MALRSFEIKINFLGMWLFITLRPVCHAVILLSHGYLSNPMDKNLPQKPLAKSTPPLLLAQGFR